MKLNKQVEEYKNEHVLLLYREHPDEVERDLNKETSTQGEYEGREVLELLQNAVDQVEHSGKIFIELKDSILTVANTGEHFSFEGVKSLMKSDLSPKRKNNDTIGQKGLGFRSLLNWSENITIYSDELSIRFTENYRKQYFTKENIDVKTALLVAPEIVTPIDKEDYVTVIKINISNKNQIEEVKRQLLNINKYTLLFLDKINDLIVCINDKQVNFKREKNSDVVTITENKQSYKFSTFAETGEINGKKYEIVIAYDAEIVVEENKLYSFFETTIDFPIKWKVHATFDLNLDRNTIMMSDENLKLLKKVARFICNSATKIGNSNSYDGLDSLIKKSDFPATLDIKGNDFDEIFQKEVLMAAVLPTLTGDKTSLSKSPILYERTPFFFKNIEDYQILLNSTNIDRNMMLDEYCTKFKAKDLTDIINEKSRNWNATQQVKVFIWWCRDYFESDILPQLLKDKTGKWICKRDRVFLDGNVIGDFPGANWVTDLKIISREYQDELERQLSNMNSFNTIDGETKTRRLYNWLNRIAKLSFIEQTTESIISPINASVKGEYKRGKEFLSWLFECYKNQETTLDVTKITTELNLPTDSGIIVRANKLFFGKDYHNNLGMSLFKDTDYQELISPNEINVKEEDVSTFMEFARKVHVLEFPVIERTIITSSTFKSDSIVPIIVKYIERVNEKRNWRITSLEFDNINSFEKLISQLQTSDIIEWLSNDYKFQNQIINHQSFGTIKYIIGQKWSNDIYYGNTPSYIKYLLNKTPWIEINKQKYAPRQIVFYEKLGQNVSGICGIKKEKLFELGLSEELIDKLDFKQDISKLSSKEILEILRFLNSSTDPKGEISKHVYAKILDNIENTIDSPNYTLNGIEIFCKDGKFYNYSKVEYAINRPPSSDKNTHFINIAYRKNSRIINQWFGVKSYEFESKYKIHLESVNHQNEYKGQEKNIITTIAALSKLTDDNLDKIKKVKITLCENVENSLNVQLGDYDYTIDDKNDFYLRIPNINYFDLIRNRDYVESFVDIFISKLRVNIDKDKVELFLSKDLEEQKQRLLNDYDVNWGEYYSKLWDSSSLTNKVIDWFSVEINDFDKGLEYQIINGINFYNLDLSFEEYEVIKGLLKKIKKDVSDLRTLIEINFIPFYIENIEKFVKQNQEKYRNNYYNFAKKGSIKQQEQYLRSIQNFRNYHPTQGQVVNSAYFDYEKLVIDVFPVLQECLSIDTDIDSEYNNNVEMLMSRQKIESNDFDYFIQNHEKYKSLLYFGVPNNIEQDIIKFLSSANKSDVNANSLLSYIKETSTIDIALQEVVVNPRNNNTRGERSKKDYENKNNANDKAGETAEDIADSELMKIYPSLIWHSKYSKRPSDRNNIPPGNIVCDMWVNDNLNDNIYFEVKSSKTEFIMSIAEYESMKENKDTYEVVLVDREKKTISRHKFDELDKLKTTSQYIFRFKQLEE